MVDANLKDLSDENLIALYPKWIEELKARQIVRTNNIVGELGEYMAISYYNKTARRPKLIPAPISTKGIDAISNKGERYSIKTTTTKTTGAFYGIDTFENKLFEKLIIVELDKNYVLKRILETDWETFFEYKHWHKTIRAYNLSITKEFLTKVEIVYSR